MQKHTEAVGNYFMQLFVTELKNVSLICSCIPITSIL